MAFKYQPFFPIIIFLVSMFCFFSPSLSGSNDGSWVLLQLSVGISAMHMQVLHNNKVVIFDRTNFGSSNISLPNHECRQNDKVLKPDCTAHSVLYDISSNTFRPLMVETDTWCSSGSVTGDGILVQTGGYLDGERVIRLFAPCDDDKCDWIELKKYFLRHRRWYATNQILPDNRIIIIGGTRAFNYEFYPNKDFKPSFELPFLRETTDRGEENNLYPFVHLLPDGNLFIFANKRSILLDYLNNKVVKEFPVIPGDDKRNYPSTGSAVLLPLWLSDKPVLPEAEVLVCGGAPAGAFFNSKRHVYVEASRTCGRLKVTDPKPEWSMEFMPMPRVMNDMLLVPTGDVIIVNGATHGTAGWDDAVNPNLNPVLYNPGEEPTRRFMVLNPSKIPRMYHSSAVLLPDGRILVGGSNPHENYNFTAYPYPTDLSLEAFSPPYLNPQKANVRPWVKSTAETVSYNEVFSITFSLAEFRQDAGIYVSLIMPSFTTHSFAMNQRMIGLNVVKVENLSKSTYNAAVNAPTTATVAPPGYYMMFVVHAGIPSPGVWIKVV